MLSTRIIKSRSTTSAQLLNTQTNTLDSSLLFAAHQKFDFDLECDLDPDL